MKIRSIASVFVCLLLLPTLAYAQADAKGGLRYSITVTKFDNAAGWHGQYEIGDAWATILTDLLNQTGKFIVLGEKDMRNEAMGEQDLAASGRTAGGAKAPVTGQMTPAQLLVKGKITHVQGDTGGKSGGINIGGLRVGGGGGTGEINATIYVVDSTTGQVLASKSVTGVAGRRGVSIGYSGAVGGEASSYTKDNVGKAVEAACAEAVTFITAQLEKIPWTGSVVQVANGKVYINRGRREGVSVGQSFVIGETQTIRDPDTGEVLDSSLNEVARVEVTDVKEKLSIGKIVGGKATSVRKGMGVRTTS